MFYNCSQILGLLTLILNMKTHPELPLVVIKTIQTAIRQLEAAGCEFRILDPIGNSYGTLEVVEKKLEKMLEQTFLKFLVS